MFGITIQTEGVTVSNYLAGRMILCTTTSVIRVNGKHRGILTSTVDLRGDNA